MKSLICMPTTRKYLQVILGALLLIILSGHSNAADLKDVYLLAEKSDPQYLQAIATNRATLEQRPIAMSRLLPTLSLGASTTLNVDDFRSGFRIGNTSGSTVTVSDSLNYSLSLNQPLFQWDLYLGFKQTDKIIAQSNAQLLAAQQDLIIRVAEAYFFVLGSQDNLEFAHADKLALSRQLEQARQRFEVGLTAITDVQEQQAGYDRAVASEIEATNRVDDTRETLREIIGEYIFDYSPLVESFPLVSPEPESIETWTTTALDQSLDVVAAVYAVESARDEVEIRRAGHLPTLELRGNTGYRTSSGGQFGNNKTQSNSIGVNLSVPIFQGGNVSARTREAIQRLEEQLQRLERARRTTQSQTRQSYLGVLSGISEVQAYKQSLVSSETALQATEAGFEVGTRTAVDVVAAQRATSQARRDYARSRYDYLLDTLRLKRAAGILSTDDLTNVNQWLD